MNLVVDLARVTIELLAPTRVSGQLDQLTPWDAAFVVDPNGLPAIPGPTIAGVLRHAFAESLNEDPDKGDRTRSAFGYQEDNLGGGDKAKEGQSSRVVVSWAHALDGEGKTVSFAPRPPGLRNDDEVLTLLRQGVLRDHVKLDARGVADAHTKFDEVMVPAGARFHFEVRVDGPKDGEGLLTELLGLLNSPVTRFGGATRRGLGAFKIVESGVQRRRFDLTRAEDRKRLGLLPVDLAQAVPPGVLEPVSLEADVEPPVGWASGTLYLASRDYWLMGGGQPRPGRPEHRHEKRSVQRDGERKTEVSEDYVDRVPVTEPRIQWRAGRGKVTTGDELEHLLPASGLKGALRHRTEWHYRRYTRSASDRRAISVVDPSVAEAEELYHAFSEAKDEALPDLGRLFGSVKERPMARGESDEPGGEAGRVFFEDGRFANAKHFKHFGRQDHVSLDRFTQGPMDGLLFSEASLYGAMLQIGVIVRLDQDTPVAARRAFAAALEDLCGGRVAVGAHAARGYGFFDEGRLVMHPSDAWRSWIEGGEG